MLKKIAVLPGDGIGKEVTLAAFQVLEAVASKYDFKFETQEFLVGGASIDKYGTPVREEVLAVCKEADAVFLGAVGGPEWDDVAAEIRPEIALLKLRKELAVFTNLRPVKVFEPLLGASALKPEVISGVDMLIVRELTGGLYFGKPQFIESIGNEERAVDTMAYKTSEIERIARVAFETARRRRKKVASVDKANILATSQLWRKTVSAVAEDYPDVSLRHVLVDNCAMQLIREPRQFDVILTENSFGDILSDEASMLTGSLGMLPSASLGIGTALYEPVHGSAPDIAGKNIANPIAAIGSIALMLRFSFHFEEAALAVEKAIFDVLNQGCRCQDFYSPGHVLLNTKEMTDRIIEKIL